MPVHRREPLSEEQRVTLHNQALASLRELQRELGTTDAPRRYLTPIRNRDRLHRFLDQLMRSGEDVPPWLYHHGPLYPGALRNRKTGHPVDAVSLANLLGKVTESRQLFDAGNDAPPRSTTPRRPVRTHKPPRRLSLLHD